MTNHFADSPFPQDNEKSNEKDRFLAELVNMLSLCGGSISKEQILKKDFQSVITTCFNNGVQLGPFFDKERSEALSKLRRHQF